MFFDEVSQVKKIAAQVATAIFVMPRELTVEIPGALVLEPTDRATISIEQVREVLARLLVKQTTDRYVVVRPAEALTEEAANAMLKSLEEPGEKVHFVLISSEPSALLPTIRSRAAIYDLRMAADEGVRADAKVKEVAKRLMVAKASDLPGLAEEITKKKDGVRAYALAVVGAAIEMLYKSYLITGKQAFLKKLPAFLTCYENIEKNGHIKLHLVADLV